MWLKALITGRKQRRSDKKTKLSRRKKTEQKKPLRMWESHTRPIPLVTRKKSISRRLNVYIGYDSDANFYSGFKGGEAEGVFVSTDDALPIGTPLELVINLEDPISVFEIDGCVCFVNKNNRQTDGLPEGMGIEFGSLTSKQKDTIRTFGKAREPFRYV